jgi:hypothetical protein
MELHIPSLCSFEAGSQQRPPLGTCPRGVTTRQTRRPYHAGSLPSLYGVSQGLTPAVTIRFPHLRVATACSVQIVMSRLGSVGNLATVTRRAQADCLDASSQAAAVRSCGQADQNPEDRSVEAAVVSKDVVLAQRRPHRRRSLLQARPSVEACCRAASGFRSLALPAVRVDFQRHLGRSLRSRRHQTSCAQRSLRRMHCDDDQ